MLPVSTHSILREGRLPGGGGLGIKLGKASCSLWNGNTCFFLSSSFIFISQSFSTSILISKAMEDVLGSIWGAFRSPHTSPSVDGAKTKVSDQRDTRMCPWLGSIELTYRGENTLAK